MREFDGDDILLNSQGLCGGQGSAEETCDADGEALDRCKFVGDTALGDCALDESEDVAGDFFRVVEVEIVFGDGIAKSGSKEGAGAP